MKNNIFRIFFEIIMITIGAVVAAFAIEEFLAPCTILDGTGLVSGKKRFVLRHYQI